MKAYKEWPTTSKLLLVKILKDISLDSFDEIDR